MKLENIPALVTTYGAAVIVAYIILKDILRRKPSVKPFLKWFIVLLLSLWQVGCWVAIDRFGAAFGNHSRMTEFAIVLAVIVLCWLLYDLWKYRR